MKTYKVTFVDNSPLFVVAYDVYEAKQKCLWIHQKYNIKSSQVIAVEHRHEYEIKQFQLIGHDVSGVEWWANLQA